MIVFDLYVILTHIPLTAKLKCDRFSSNYVVYVILAVTTEINYKSVLSLKERLV